MNKQKRNEKKPYSKNPDTEIEQEIVIPLRDTRTLPSKLPNTLKNQNNTLIKVFYFDPPKKKSLKAI